MAPNSILDDFCSYVITPYNEYPQLLGLLLKLLNGELAWSTRREVLKVAQLHAISFLWHVVLFLNLLIISRFWE